MTKEVFLDELREALKNEIGAAEIENTISYYKEYIENNVESEEVIIENLGEPRLIAKTIIETTPLGGPQGGTVDEDGNQSTENPYPEMTVPWHKKVVNWILILLVLFIVLRVLGVIAGLFFRIGIPILLVIWIVHMFKNRS